MPKPSPVKITKHGSETWFQGPHGTLRVSDGHVVSAWDSSGSPVPLGHGGLDQLYGAKQLAAWVSTPPGPNCVQVLETLFPDAVVYGGARHAVAKVKVGRTVKTVELDGARGLRAEVDERIVDVTDLHELRRAVYDKAVATTGSAAAMVREMRKIFTRAQGWKVFEDDDGPDQGYDDEDDEVDFDWSVTAMRDNVGRGEFGQVSVTKHHDDSFNVDYGSERFMDGAGFTTFAEVIEFLRGL